VFVAEKRCVSCEVRTELLYIIQVKFSSWRVKVAPSVRSSLGLKAWRISRTSSMNLIKFCIRKFRLSMHFIFGYDQMKVTDTLRETFSLNGVFLELPHWIFIGRNDVFRALEENKIYVIPNTKLSVNTCFLKLNKRDAIRTYQKAYIGNKQEVLGRNNTLLSFGTTRLT
jgi:hypothetical protein